MLQNQNQEYETNFAVKRLEAYENQLLTFITTEDQCVNLFIKFSILNFVVKCVFEIN